MSSTETALRRPAELALTIGTFAALLGAMLPLLSVIEASWWLAGSVVLTLIVLAAGFVARRFRLPAVAVSLIEAAAWLLFMTVVFLRDTALLWLIPTPETFRVVPGRVTAAIDEIVLGSAPLEPGIALTFFIVGAMGLLAIVIDHVVLTARMPLLATVGLIAVSLIPSIAVPGDIDVLAFIVFAAAILFLLRAETRTRVRDGSARRAGREQGAGPQRIGSGGVSATALGIGAVALIVAIVATPLLPPPARPAINLGTGASIDPSLQLGDDLRRPANVEVLKVRSTAPSPPYLRAATLSQFNGQVWQPDRSSTLPLSSPDGLAPVTVDEGIQTVQYVTNVDVENLISAWLPVAFPAVSITGLQGDWSAVPYNRTVVSRTENAQGQSYEIVTDTPKPTLEQIRAHHSVGSDNRSETTALPPDLPPIIGELATEITAGADTDYDKLAALQSWFRSSAFRYSLDAPVKDGFDGTGAQAVAEFLRVRAGYCVHFASAFALMARTLGMPARIVVGYLPGSLTTTAVGEQNVYTVTSSQLHAWPEVYFQGIGWIPFEPTNSLGVATSFSSASIATGDSADTPDTAPVPEESTSAAAPLDPTDADQLPADRRAEAAASSANPLPTLSVLLGILIALSIPAVIRAAVRRRQSAAARRGDAVAAWASVQDAAIDLGIPVPGTESARALGTRLVEAHGAPPGQMSVLVTAIERASYSLDGRSSPEHGAELADAASAVRGALRAASDPPRRVLAIVVPRSLIVRPGSVYAGSGAAARAR